MLRFLALCLTLLVFTGTVAAGEKKMTENSAIVITSFGTTYESTLHLILNMVEEVRAKYPETPVKLAFTSNIIRKTWNERAEDEAYRSEHPDVPEELYSVKNVLGAMADLQNEGYRNIVVQPTLINNGEEYLDMTAYVNALASIKTVKERFRPFNTVAIGKPLTGTFSHMEQVEALAKALAADVMTAEKAGAVLVYMGHGNEHMSQGMYYELEIVMNRMYGEPIVIGLVEGLPDLDTVLDKLAIINNKKIILKPLMFVAGDHAQNDMAGDEDDSWKTVLTKAGYTVTPIVEGLGSNPAVRLLFINHLALAAMEAGIDLR
jgi:sirohydrochlorin cobaltochelatase